MNESLIKELVTKALKVFLDIADSELAIGDMPEWASLAGPI
tara:strand:+ start:164 stop:286 length:123 start_codon:yes stop_codon:yes gene_type:complete